MHAYRKNPEKAPGSLQTGVKAVEEVHLLVERFSQPFEGEDAQGVARDSAEALWALLRRKAGGVVQGLVRQGLQRIPPHVRVPLQAQNLQLNFTLRPGMDCKDGWLCFIVGQQIGLRGERKSL